MQGVAACTRMQLDRAAYDKLLGESAEEIVAIQAGAGPLAAPAPRSSMNAVAESTGTSLSIDSR